MVSCQPINWPPRTASRLLACGIIFFYAASLACALEPSELAVIINETDSQSVAVGRYYRQQRDIPYENVIYVSFHSDGPNIERKAFEKLRRTVLSNTVDSVKAYAITWTEPYKVDCMSLTSALTLGVNSANCALGCLPTRQSPYYQGDTVIPIKHNSSLDVAPISMMLAGMSEKEVFKVIDRGKQSDFSHPAGDAFLLESTDSARNVRAKAYRDEFVSSLGATQRKAKKANFITGESSVLMYAVGAKTVPYLGRNTFLPGAVGDHLTSAGGMLTDSYQMSALRWLEAGATASYGAVVEPCNIVEKFPNPVVLLNEIESGESLITAYWRSVKMPGQGVFIGEPLAKPFATKNEQASTL